MNHCYIYRLVAGCLLASVTLFSACKKKSDFVGVDNYITSFSLKKGSSTFTAAITDSSIIIKAPEGYSLDSAVATLSLSEHASIYPNPTAIVSWGDESLFVVTSYDGMKKTYKYVVQRSDISLNGSIVLATQADVDAFAAKGVTEIAGNLVIGSAGGKDSITNLNGLYQLRKIDYGLTIYPTFSATAIIGLDNLTSVGDLVIQPAPDLSNFTLPALTTAKSITITNHLVYDVEFPKLTNITQGLTITAPLNVLSLPNLKQVGGAISFTSDEAINSALIPVFSFPALTSAGSVSITGFNQARKLDFPVMTSCGDINLSNLSFMDNVNFPSLQTSSGTITFPEPSKVTIASFPALTQAAGLSLSGKTLNAVEFPRLKTLANLQVQRVALDGIKDFTALTTVTGQVFLNQLPNMTQASLPASLKTIGTLFIIADSVPPPTQVDVRGVAIGELNLRLMNTTVIGDDVFHGTLTVNPSAPGASFPTLQGLSEVDSLAFGIFATYYITDLNFKGIHKIDKSFTLSYNSFQTISWPDLEEVGGDFIIPQMGSLNQQTLTAPLLKKVGGIFSVAVESPYVTGLSFPALTTVGGDFQVETAYYGGSLTSLTFPALMTIGGGMQINAQGMNTGLTNLDGFAALTSVRSVNISGQSSLTSYIGLQGILPVLNPMNWNTSGNAYNPNYEDLKTGKWTNQN